MGSERRGSIVVRRNDDGTMDEVVLYDRQGRCVFHLEQMSDEHWWMGLYQHGGAVADLHVNLFRRKKDVKENTEWQCACDGDIVCDYQHE